MSAQTTSSRVVISLRTRREAEDCVGVTAAVCQATRRELVCLYRGDLSAMAAWQLPIENMLDFSGEPLQIRQDALLSAMRRDADACRAVVEQAAKRLNIAWRFATGTDQRSISNDDATGSDMVVMTHLDARSNRHNLCKAVAALQPECGIVIAHPMRNSDTAAPVLLLEGDMAGSGATRLATALAAHFRRKLMTSSLETGIDSIPRRPVAVVVSATAFQQAAEAAIDHLFALRVPIVITT